MSGGETNLSKMLATLHVERRPGTYAYVQFQDRPTDLDGVAALVEETEATTIVVPLEIARIRGWEVVFEAAWLTLEVHSSLEAIGLTAAVSAALGANGIPCNILAGTFHDHILVPEAAAPRAIATLESLRSSTGGTPLG